MKDNTINFKINNNEGGAKQLYLFVAAAAKPLATTLLLSLHLLYSVCLIFPFFHLVLFLCALLCPLYFDS